MNAAGNHSAARKWIAAVWENNLKRDGENEGSRTWSSGLRARLWQLETSA
jgi:hypothetical protein